MTSAPSVEFIFSTQIPFEEKALAIFRYQSEHNVVYKRYIEAINCNTSSIKELKDIPFLPISFFKTSVVACGRFRAARVFESSGTTGATTSKHHIKDVLLYQNSFVKGFESFYGYLPEYCILALLPSYLERQNSSLVYMVQKLMDLSGHSTNGFFLSNYGELSNKLQQLKASEQKTLLIGVTFALLDFAEQYPQTLLNTIVIETGGMKGRKKELLRQEVHSTLKTAFCLNAIHSEYGMTELLSQAYAAADGVFVCPHWMRVFLREEDDPFKLINNGTASSGVLNIIDLANLHSCSFIASEDLATVHPDGSFEILGRIDASDVRGCSMLAV